MTSLKSLSFLKVQLETRHLVSYLLNGLQGSALEYCQGGRVLLRVTEGQMQFAPAALLEKSFPAVMEDDERLAGFFAANLHVLPAKLRANAGAEGLGNRLFRGESRRQMWRGVSVRETIRDFVRPQDASQKTLTKLLVRRPDPSDFNDVDARA